MAPTETEFMRSGKQRQKTKERTSDLGSNEKSIELAEDAEHLVGVLRASKTISKSRDDVVLDSSNSFVVGSFSSDPNFGSLWEVAYESAREIQV